MVGDSQKLPKAGLVALSEVEVITEHQENAVCSSEFPSAEDGVSIAQGI